MTETEATPAGGRRNVLILASSLALNMTAISIMVVVSALVGQMLAENKALATLPFSLQFIGTMAISFPISMLMQRFGRRFGFTLGAMLGVFAGAIMVVAVYLGDFWLFALGNALVGAANGVAQFYRFAAAEVSSAAFRPKAISLVLAGGVVAAIFGPELAKWSIDLLNPYIFAGCFVVVMALNLAAVGLLQALRIPGLTLAQRKETGRPLSAIVRQPAYIVSVIGGISAFSVMIMVMTATPLAMVACGHAFEDAAFVIQWHALGMFAPSFVTGHLIARFGVLNIMFVGVAMFAGCIATNLAGIDVFNFWLANLLLGVGWNFLFIGSSTLLTETHTPAERGKAQGLNDFLVFGIVAVCSFAAGALHSILGWAAVNLGGILPAVAILIALVWLRGHRRAAVPAS
ncbi:MAG: MFS transporter [Dongiaceae bacterium]